MGTQYLHSYFAARRDDAWMMNELYQFPNLQEEADFDVVLEGFSESSFKNQAIYVEGVEFRAISNASLKIPFQFAFYLYTFVYRLYFSLILQF